MSRKLLVCTMHRSGPAASCGGKGGAGLAQLLAEQLQQCGLDVAVEEIKCLVKCQDGPNLRLMPDGVSWSHVAADEVTAIVDSIARITKGGLQK